MQTTESRAIHIHVYSLETREKNKILKFITERASHRYSLKTGEKKRNFKTLYGGLFILKNIFRYNNEKACIVKIKVVLSQHDYRSTLQYPLLRFHHFQNGNTHPNVQSRSTEGRQCKQLMLEGELQGRFVTVNLGITNYW